MTALPVISPCGRTTFVASTGTISRAKAIFFATHGPNPSGQILRFVSSRVPRLGSIRDQEGLFTGYVGAPYEQGTLETAK